MIVIPFVFMHVSDTLLWVCFFLFFWFRKSFWWRRWIGTREWRSRERRRRLMQMRFVLRVRGGCATILPMPWACFKYLSLSLSVSLSLSLSISDCMFVLLTRTNWNDWSFAIWRLICYLWGSVSAKTVCLVGCFYESPVDCEFLRAF